MYRYVPGVSKVTVVSRLDPAGMETSVGRDAVDRLGAGAMALVGRRVADDPFVVDRVVVAQQDRERHARRHDQAILLVVRVVDQDLGGHRTLDRQAGPGCRDAGQPEREDEAADQGDAPRPANGGHRCGPLRPSTAAGAGE